MKWDCVFFRGLWTSCFTLSIVLVLFRSERPKIRDDFFVSAKQEKVWNRKFTVPFHTFLCFDRGLTFIWTNHLYFAHWFKYCLNLHILISEGLGFGFASPVQLTLTQIPNCKRKNELAIGNQPELDENLLPMARCELLRHILMNCTWRVGCRCGDRLLKVFHVGNRSWSWLLLCCSLQENIIIYLIYTLFIYSSIHSFKCAHNLFAILCVFISESLLWVSCSCWINIW